MITRNGVDTQDHPSRDVLERVWERHSTLRFATIFENEAQEASFDHGFSLIEAAVLGDTHAVNRLLPLADTRVKVDGWGAFAHAVLSSDAAHPQAHVECARLLLPTHDRQERGANANTLAMVALATSSPQFIPLILSVSDPRAVNAQGRTALMIAVHGWVHEALAALLPISDANAVDRDGENALMHAITAKNEEAMQALIPLTDLLARNKRGESPMQLIARDLPHQPLHQPIMDAMKHRVFEQLAEQERLDLAQSIASTGGSEEMALNSASLAKKALPRRPPRSL